MKIYGNLAKALTPSEEHILFHHNPENTDGWITLAKKDPLTKRFKQYHYQPQDLANRLSEWIGEDVYFSQNSFFRPSRRIDTIRQLRSLYVDLDVYNKGLDPRWVLGKLELEYFGQSVPEPNMVLFSGRGLVLIWHIVPIPYMVLPLWRAVETHFTQCLKELGADPKATDPTRIFRIAGSINSKNGAIVEAEYRHSYRYDIHDLQYDYLPELQRTVKGKKKAAQGKVIRMFNLYTLHLSRAKDIAHLVELRNGEVDGHRETICFLYRYFTCCYTADPKRALEEMLDLNSEFTNPLPEREVKKAAKSAQKAWAAKSDEEANKRAKALGYPGAGYNLKNTKIIDWLDITLEEQVHMKSIIGKDEKNRRRRVAYKKKTGMSPKEQKIELIRECIANNPDLSLREIAEETGIAKSTVGRLVKLI